MNPPATKFKTETALQRERRLFREESRRVGNCLLNKALELTTAGSLRRNLVLILFFVMLGVLINLRFYPLSQWTEQLGYLLQYVLNPLYRDLVPDALPHFMSFAWGALTDPRFVRFLPVIVLPFVIALQAASGYLSDLFELPREDIARQFIVRIAFSGSQKPLRIKEGDVAPGSLKSPVYLIGGPGKVVVELDSAAVFEKPNGEPHIIGPTTKGGQVLEGFERFRQALDLRDLYTEPLEVKSRSLDGIPVSARDVRMVYSIWREGRQATAESPHPFSRRAVASRVYRQTCSVVVDGPHPSECNPSQEGAIQALIRKELGGFMAQHPLAEYLASIGQPEIEQAQQQQQEIAKAVQVAEPGSESGQQEPDHSPPPFQARHAITSLFSQFAQDFTAKAIDLGLELKWIGVGTWKTPSTIIPEKHLEAWRLSRENMARGNPKALEGIKNQARLVHLLQRIQTIPMARYREDLREDHKHSYIARDLLLGYREQIKECIEGMEKEGRPVPETLPAAIKIINNAIGHFLGGDGSSRKGTVPAPKQPSGPTPDLSASMPDIPAADPEEDALYHDLLRKVGHDPGQVDELIENERKRAPQANRKAWLQQAIDHWPEDDQ